MSVKWVNFHFKEALKSHFNLIGFKSNFECTLFPPKHRLKTNLTLTWDVG